MLFSLLIFVYLSFSGLVFVFARIQSSSILVALLLFLLVFGLPQFFFNLFLFLLVSGLSLFWCTFFCFCSYVVYSSFGEIAFTFATILSILVVCSCC